MTQPKVLNLLVAFTMAIVSPATLACQSVPGAPRVGDPCSGPAIVDTDGVASIAFSGRVLGRFADGTTRPVHEVQFFVAHESQRDRLPITTKRDGRFRGEVLLSSHGEVKCRDGKYVANTEVSPAAILVRAGGCVGQQIMVDATWQQKSIELSCDLGGKQ